MPWIIVSCNVLNDWTFNSSSSVISLAKLYLTAVKTISPYNSLAIRSSILYGSGSPYHSKALVYTSFTI